MSTTVRAWAAVGTILAATLVGCSGTPSADSTTSPSPTGTSEATPPSRRTVEVYFSNEELGDPCGDVFAVTRDVPATAPLRGTLEALLAGPTADERADGYGGWFGEETATLLAGVRLEDHRALVSFRSSLPEVIPNASTSCGSAALLGALDATLTQFPEVDGAWYDLEGDRDAFYEWLQLSAPDDASTS